MIEAGKKYVDIKQADSNEFVHINWVNALANNTTLQDDFAAGFVLADSIQWLNLDDVQLLMELNRIQGGKETKLVVLKTHFWGCPKGSLLHDILNNHPDVEPRRSRPYGPSELNGAIFEGAKSNLIEFEYDEIYTRSELHWRILSDSHTGLGANRSLLMAVDKASGFTSGREHLQLTHKCTMQYGSVKVV